MCAALLAVSCASTVVPSPPASSVGAPTPTSSGSATTRVEATPGVDPTPTTTPPPVRSAEPQSTGVRANALGTLTGNWLFVGKQVPGALYSRVVQIWAIPLDGGAPKLAFTYDV